jgi:MYXO-CTERM domain-containing protein
MSEVRPLAYVSALLLAVATATGCSGGVKPDTAQSHSMTPIVDGTVANDYPEAALLDLYVGKSLSQACSGALVAPQVVLTAGHCVVGVDHWVVSLPYAHGQRSHASWGEVYDYQPLGDNVNPAWHDVGLVFLDVPLYLEVWPTLGTDALPNGSTVVNIGRIQDGQYSATDLFVSAPVTVSDGHSAGFPFDYAAPDTIQPGDSGGPTLWLDGPPHEIVAVNSGVGGDTEVLARIDMLAWWITQETWSHGGFAPGQTQPQSGSSGTGTTGDGNGQGHGVGTSWSAHEAAGGHGCGATVAGARDRGGFGAVLVAGVALLFARARRRGSRPQLAETRPTASSEISGRSSP